MLQMITMEERRTKRCHYCDTWVSVKYRIHSSELDKTYYGVNGYVYCCGKCTDKHYLGDKK